LPYFGRFSGWLWLMASLSKKSNKLWHEKFKTYRSLNEIIDWNTEWNSDKW
jgi:hypothetical protein